MVTSMKVNGRMTRSRHQSGQEMSKKKVDMGPCFFLRVLFVSLSFISQTRRDWNLHDPPLDERPSTLLVLDFA